MPTRTLRQTPKPSTMNKDYTRAIAYHGSSITIFWVLFLFMILGLGMLVLTFYAKLNLQEQSIAALNEQLNKTQKSLDALQQKAVITRSKPVEVTVTIPPASSTNTRSTATANASYAPLNRGALSPDGTKYAGFDDTTKGKSGIGVITLADKRVRHVVLFNTKTESSGVGNQAWELGVSWRDNSTIQYDVLVQKATGPVLETRTVKIGF